MERHPNKLALFGTMIFLVAIIVYINMPRQPIDPMKKQPLVKATTSASDAIPTSRTPADAPAIGGAFMLTDQDGHPFSEQNLMGKYALVFFGFTHCPDMCPLAMGTITEALAALDEKTRSAITPVFITVDPERDSSAVIKTYLTHFAPGFVGLTGTHEQVKKAASSYKVFYERANPGDQDYNVNHSGYIYLISRDGEYMRHFSHDDKAADMTAGLKKAIDEEEAIPASPSRNTAPAAATTSGSSGEENAKP